MVKDISPHLEAILSAFSTIPFNQLLGLKLESFSPAHVIVGFNMKNDLIGNFVKGILHGGVEMLNEDNTLVATGSGTYSLRP